MPPELILCIQKIHTHWDKSARGGLEADKRSHVPEVLRVPAFQPSSTPLSYITHRAYFSKDNAFAKPVKNAVEATLAEPLDIGGISLSFLGDCLAVYYQWDYSQGAPPRHSSRKEALHLPVGSWGQVCYNGRNGGDHWDSSEWSYNKWVYNIGLFTTVPPSIFLKTIPVKVASYMALLK